MRIPLSCRCLAPALTLLLAACHTAPEAMRPPATPAAATPEGASTARATYLSLIRQLREQGQSYAVLAHIASYEQRWGASPETDLLRAHALRGTGQHAAAAEAYQALLQGPQAAEAYRGLGLLAAAAGRHDDAIGYFEAAAQLQPADPGTLSDLGYVQLQAGRLDAARVPLMTAAQLAPTDSRVLANLAAYFIAAGQPERAEAVLQSPHVSEGARRLLREQRASAVRALPRLRLDAALRMTADTPAAAHQPPSAQGVLP